MAKGNLGVAIGSAGLACIGSGPQDRRSPTNRHQQHKIEIEVFKDGFVANHTLVSCLIVLILIGAPGCIDEVVTDISDGSESVVQDIPYLGTGPKVIDPLAAAVEPMLGVTPDGVLFTYAVPPDDEIGTQGVYRSIDGGASWELVYVPVVPSFDPDLVVDQEGTVWFDITYLGCNLVAVSRDSGDSWSENPLACLGPIQDRQRIVPTEGGEAFLTYAQGGRMQFVRTQDYGMTWVPVPMVMDAWVVDERLAQAGGGFYNNRTGQVSFTVTVSDGPPSPRVGEIRHSLGLASTKDGGQTFVLERVPYIDSVQNAENQTEKLGLYEGVVDSGGNIHLAWLQVTDGLTEVMVGSSVDGGQSWGAPIRVDTTDHAKALPAITAFGSGQVAVVYYEADRPGLPGGVDDDTTWNVTLAWSGDVFDPAPSFQYGRMTPEASHQGRICLEGMLCPLSDRDMLDQFDVQVLPNRGVGAVWSDSLAAGEGIDAVVMYGSVPGLPM